MQQVESPWYNPSRHIVLTTAFLIRVPSAQTNICYLEKLASPFVKQISRWIIDTFWVHEFFCKNEGDKSTYRFYAWHADLALECRPEKNQNEKIKVLQNMKRALRHVSLEDGQPKGLHAGSSVGIREAQRWLTADSSPFLSSVDWLADPRLALPHSCSQWTHTWMPPSLVFSGAAHPLLLYTLASFRSWGGQ